MEREQQYWVSPQEIHNSEDQAVAWEDIDSWDRPMVDHCPGGNNHDRHAWNLSHYTGYYRGEYYNNGVKMT